MQVSSKKISVILRVKNKEFFVGFCLQSLIDHLTDFEVIVVNNKSDDNTIKTIKHFKKSNESIDNKDNNHTDMSFYEINNYTPGRALNLGVSKASGENILIISSHCKIINFDQKYSIDLLKNYSAIFFKQIPVWNGRRIKPKYIWSNFKDDKSENLYSDNENRYFFHNAFSMFKRKTLIKKPFNEDLISKEDRYWANEEINNGNKILYLPKNSAEHFYTEHGSTWRNL